MISGLIEYLYFLSIPYNWLTMRQNPSVLLHPTLGMHQNIPPFVKKYNHLQRFEITHTHTYI